MSVVGSNALAGASGGAGAAGYEIERSLRFNSDNSAHLERNITAAGNQQQMTFSFWVKRNSVDSSDESAIVAQDYDTSASNHVTARSLSMHFSSNQLKLYDYGASTGAGDTGSSSPWTPGSVGNGRLFRDPAAWTHCVFAIDTTQATAANRCKVWINGESQTHSSQPPQNVYLSWGQVRKHYIGIQKVNGSFTRASNFQLSEFHFIDGQQLAASDFGDYDSDNNWNPKEYSGSYGTNGFYLKFADNSSNAALGTDSSGQGNTWTVNNISATSKTSSTGNSWYFDGTNDQCSVDDSSLALGTGDFTVEYFLKPDTGYNAQSTHYNGSGNYPNFETDGATKFRLMGGNTYGSTLSAGSWYHCAVVRENGACTMWVNGTRVAHNVSHTFNYTSTFHTMGSRASGTYTKGWLSNIHVIVGTAKYSPSSSTINIPLVPISTHPNTKLLALHASTMTDGSGQNLTITNNGATVSSDLPSGGAAGSPQYSDSMIDSPTNYEASSGNNGGNYATWNPLQKYAAFTLSNGNLDFTDNNTVGGGDQGVHATIAPVSGKFYWEMTLSTLASENYIGISKSDKLTQTLWTGGGVDGYYYYNNGNKIGGGNGNGGQSYGASFGAGDVIGVAVDWDNGKVTFYKNGTSQGDAFTGKDLTGYIPAFYFNTNQSSAGVVNFGQRPFAYTPPTGYKSLCTQNLADPTITDGSTAMDVSLWTGNGTSQTISGLNHSPDLVWVKARSFAADPEIYDIVRGAGKRLYTSLQNAESSPSSSVNSFTSDGFTVTGGGGVNNNTSTYVGWTWDAGSSTVSNTDGSITSQVRASQTNGFSVITYSGTGSNATVGHGLNAKPDFYVVKTYSTGDAWMGYHSSQGATKFFEFTTGGFSTGSNRWNDTEPTSSVISLGTEQGVNGSGRTHVAYLWTSIPGFSSFGSYIGNGSADGPFIYTGFRVRYLLQKRADSSGSWAIKDAAREPYNVVDTRLYADASNADMTQSSFHEVDFLSNGFKVRSPGGSEDNASGGTFVYLAFASHPFKTARAR